MKDYLAIEEVRALEILDSRGNPTVQVEVVTEDGSLASHYENTILITAGDPELLTDPAESLV